jgi:hypothetical protein
MFTVNFGTFSDAGHPRDASDVARNMAFMVLRNLIEAIHMRDGQ